VNSINIYLTHWLLCRPQPSVTSLALSSTSDVFTFGQNWHQLYSSFQWCLVHSGRLIETWSMHKNAQKDERKTQSRISYTLAAPWLFLRHFLTPSKPSGRPTTAAKRKAKGKKERGKNSKVEAPKAVGHFLVQKFWLMRMPEPKCLKTLLCWRQVNKSGKALKSSNIFH